MFEAEKNEDSALKIFRKEKVMNLHELAELLGCCERTVQRRLKQWRAYTSYNKNGSYYVLPDIPKFDQNGLWTYKKIFFSRHGNLRKTVIWLVNHSQAGLSAREIEELMRLPSNSFLSYFRNMQELHHEKLGGRYLYFSSDKLVLERQKQKRQEADGRVNITNLPTDAEAVVILVERIKYPHLSIEQLSTRLSKGGYSIKAGTIRNLFEHHGIQKKT